MSLPFHSTAPLLTEADARICEALAAASGHIVTSPERIQMRIVASLQIDRIAEGKNAIWTLPGFNVQTLCGTIDRTATAQCMPLLGGDPQVLYVSACD